MSSHIRNIRERLENLKYSIAQNALKSEFCAENYVTSNIENHNEEIIELLLQVHFEIGQQECAELVQHYSVLHYFEAVALHCSVRVR